MISLGEIGKLGVRDGKSGMGGDTSSFASCLQSAFGAVSLRSADARQLEREGTAAANLGFDRDGNLVELEDVGDDGESEPETEVRAGALLSELFETVENLRQLFLWNAGAGIRYEESHRIGVAEVAERNRTASCRELQRIPQEIVEDPPDQFHVALHERITAGFAEPRGDAAAIGWRPEARSRTGGEIPDRHFLGMEAYLARFKAGELKQFVNHRRQRLAALSESLIASFGFLRWQCGALQGKRIRERDDAGGGGAEIVSNVRHQLPPRFITAAQFIDIRHDLLGHFVHRRREFADLVFDGGWRPLREIAVPVCAHGHQKLVKVFRNQREQYEAKCDRDQTDNDECDHRSASSGVLEEQGRSTAVIIGAKQDQQISVSPAKVHTRHRERQALVLIGNCIEGRVRRSVAERRLEDFGGEELWLQERSARVHEQLISAFVNKKYPVVGQQTAHAGQAGPILVEQHGAVFRGVNRRLKFCRELRGESPILDLHGPVGESSQRCKQSVCKGQLEQTAAEDIGDCDLAEKPAPGLFRVPRTGGPRYRWRHQLFHGLSVYHRRRSSVEMSLRRRRGSDALRTALMLIVLALPAGTARAGTCDEHDAVMLERSTASLRFRYDPVVLAPEFVPERAVVPFDLRSDAPGVVQLDRAGRVFFAPVRRRGPREANAPLPRTVATVAGCDKELCSLFPADVNQEHRGDVVVLHHSDRQAVLIRPGVPAPIPLGAVEAEPLGFVSWDDGVSLHALSRREATLFDQLVVPGSTSLGASRAITDRLPEGLSGLLQRRPGEEPVLLSKVRDDVGRYHVVSPLRLPAHFTTITNFEPAMFDWINESILADINGDGLTDIFTHMIPMRDARAALAYRDGYFEVPIEAEIPLPHLSRALAAADFDRDGLQDILFFDRESTYWFLGQSLSAEPLRRVPVVIDGVQITTGDDGRLCRPPESFAPGSPLSVGSERMTVVRLNRDVAGIPRLLVRGYAENGAALAVGAEPVGPFVCVGYSPSVPATSDNSFMRKWGIDQPGLCSDDYGIYLGFEVNKQPVEQIGAHSGCCPLPFRNMLIGDPQKAVERCPDGMIAIGEEQVNPFERNLVWWCRKLSDRFQLGPETSGRYFGVGYSVRGHRERLRRDLIPVGIRTAAARIGFNGWDSDGCVGSPPGSVVTGRSKDGLGCERLKFREVQYRGLAGDPPAGTPVKMFPDCSLVENMFRPDAGCLKNVSE